MKKKFDPVTHYQQTMKEVGYVPRKQASQATYDAIGFMSGLEVHQQLLTDHKLFCRCPAGVLQKGDVYDAEVIRHMRPTLSELGEYDGTALMEFKTRKTIVYHLQNATTCTYEVDDTPPFPMDRQALHAAIGISLLSKLNIVGEVHITRKQYLDGSIPAGFQRTAIIGVEGEIPLKHKKVRLIQLSLEEDSCREISDIGHTRVYKTDRLGMPLIETVTYPDMVNPDEVQEACDYIRFLNRSTGMVRTGIGAGRQDVNVSCKGGTRVEIKGVAHTRWIPELTHNECFRQWALLKIRDRLNKKFRDPQQWQMSHKRLNFYDYNFPLPQMREALERKEKFVAVNLPGFKGILSHFTQPGKCFANELSDRLKVIACLEKPNMIFREDGLHHAPEGIFEKLALVLNGQMDDTQLVFWGPEDDIDTALETIEERCRMAFEGVPEETRKSFPDGTTIFERVLPGADRMYPDTDSPPIPLSESLIEGLKEGLPEEVIDRYHQMQDWQIPEDTYTYIFKKNLFPLLRKVVENTPVLPRFVGTFLGHRLKYIEGQYALLDGFNTAIIPALFEFLKAENLQAELALDMLPVIYQYPQMDFESVLTSMGFKRTKPDEVLSRIPFLREKFRTIRRSSELRDEVDWIMGQLRKVALGNLPLAELKRTIQARIEKESQPVKN